jgi:hypothetical protein
MDDNATTTCSPLSTKDISILTLQKSDLVSSNKKHEDESLVLMQLPCSLTVNDIQGARMIATHNQQATLVVERKGMSFDISRVETSNAYICVSPNQQQERPAAKRTKSNDSKTLVSVHARLLQPGGSGASFLELKPKCLSISHLQEKLSECVFDPYNPEKQWTGKTLATLAESLQVSQKQVMTGLQRMQALCLHENGVALYGLLSQEALQEATSYIIATLTECEEFAHYTRGISRKECIHQVMTRVPTEERYPHLQDVIQHTLTTLESDDSNDNVDMESDGDIIRLNVTKASTKRPFFYLLFLVIILYCIHLFTFYNTRWQNVWCNASFVNRRNHGTSKNYCRHGSAKCQVLNIKFPSPCYRVLPCWIRVRESGVTFRKRTFPPI